MTDPLFARAQLAIDESQLLRHSSRMLKSQFDHEREKLRVSLFEAAMSRSEAKAYRNNKAEAF